MLKLYRERSDRKKGEISDWKKRLKIIGPRPLVGALSPGFASDYKVRTIRQIICRYPIRIELIIETLILLNVCVPKYVLMGSRIDIYI